VAEGLGKALFTNRKAASRSDSVGYSGSVDYRSIHDGRDPLVGSVAPATLSNMVRHEGGRYAIVYQLGRATGGAAQIVATQRRCGLDPDWSQNAETAGGVTVGLIGVVDGAAMSV